jgi:hypothetical protein
MGQNRLDYERMCADALRGVVRRALEQVAHRGLPGGNHFLITFKTGFPGVAMPDYLRERYPDTISVMLQYEFWSLEVEDDLFSVTLSFNDVRERLTVPFLAVTAFVDPFAKFQLKFEAPARRCGGTRQARQADAAEARGPVEGRFAGQGQDRRGRDARRLSQEVALTSRYR